MTQEETTEAGREEGSCQMRMTYRFNVPAVSYRNAHYFPEDVSSKELDDGTIRYAIQAVYYQGKWMQVTVHVSSESFIRKIQDYALENSKVRLIRLEAQRAEESKKDLNQVRERVNELVGNYQLKSPYHSKLKLLPFNILGFEPMNKEYPVEVATVEYRGWTRTERIDYYKLETIEEWLKTGFIFPKGKVKKGQINIF